MSSSFRRPIAVIREDTGHYVDGIWAPGARMPLEGVTASVQPTSGYDLQKLPEGQRTSRTFTLYTDTALRTADEKADPKIAADRVTLPDGEYVVIHVAPWQNNVINHYKAIVARDANA